MNHFDRLSDIARALGLEPVSPQDNTQLIAHKLVAILAAHIETTNATLAQLTPRKPGRPRKEKDQHQWANNPSRNSPPPPT